MKKNTYIRKASEATGKGIAYTEIIINASPEVVRAKFLAFENWGQWCKVIPKIAIASGDINDLSTKPSLELTLDFGRKNDPAPAPVNPIVYENSPEVFNWGFKMPILKANHVFIFEPMNDGKKTHLVHYEKMTGLFKTFFMTNKTKTNMTQGYNAMNLALKELCESTK